MMMIQIAVFVVVFLAVAGIGLLMHFSQKAEEKRRKARIIQGRQALHGSGTPRKNAMDPKDKRRAELAKKLKDGGEEDSASRKKKATLGEQISHAGLNVSVAKFWLFSVITALGFILAAKVFGMNLFVCLMAGITGLLGAPKVFLKMKTAGRQKKFIESFGDALEAMVRLLKAGMPVSEAISMVSREFDGPVGEEMARIYDKQKIGTPLEEAVREIAEERMPLPEMRMFATGISIQAQTGASLSEVLLNIAGVIRARFKLKRKVKSLSSEAKSSAMIIGALPILVSSGIYFINPEYILTLVYDSFGKIMLIGAGVWMCVGIIVMKLMINIKV